jgi:predicted SprT family Zn-dependent metalloprotease
MPVLYFYSCKTCDHEMSFKKLLSTSAENNTFCVKCLSRGLLYSHQESS